MVHEQRDRLAPVSRARVGSTRGYWPLAMRLGVAFGLLDVVLVIASFVTDRVLPKIDGVPPWAVTSEAPPGERAPEAGSDIKETALAVRHDKWGLNA